MIINSKKRYFGNTVTQYCKSKYDQNGGSFCPQELFVSYLQWPSS